MNRTAWCLRSGQIQNVKWGLAGNKKLKLARKQNSRVTRLGPLSVHYFEKLEE